MLLSRVFRVMYRRTPDALLRYLHNPRVIWEFDPAPRESLLLPIRCCQANVQGFQMAGEDLKQGHDEFSQACMLLTANERMEKQHCMFAILKNTIIAYSKC